MKPKRLHRREQGPGHAPDEVAGQGLYVSDLVEGQADDCRGARRPLLSWEGTAFELGTGDFRAFAV